MEPADERRQHVAGLQVVIVARSVEIGRHRAQVGRAVLAVVRPAHLDAGDLGEGIRPVGGLERPGEQVVLADRLRAIARVDARGAEEEQPPDARAPGLVDHVGLDRQIVVDEIGGGRAVGQDAADPCRREKDDVGPLGLEERSHRARIGEVQLRVRARDEVRVALRLQRAHQCRAGEAAVAGDVDAGIRCHDAPARTARPRLTMEGRIRKGRSPRPATLHPAAHARPLEPSDASPDTAVACARRRAGRRRAGLGGVARRLLARSAGAAADARRRDRRPGRQRRGSRVARARSLPRRLRAEDRADRPRARQRRAAGQSHVARRVPGRPRRAEVGTAPRGVFAEQLRGGDPRPRADAQAALAHA